MRQLLTSVAAAVLLAASLNAQGSSNAKPGAAGEDRNAMTLTGCLSGVGGLTYTLSNLATSNTTPPGKSSERSNALPATGTSGTVAAYELSPKAGLDLAQYVGQKVEVTGVLVPMAPRAAVAATPRDTSTNDEPSRTGDATTKTDQARSTGPRLSVTSIRTVAAACS